MEYTPMADTGDADAFTRAYLEAAEWADLEEESVEALELSVSPKWDAISIAKATAICNDFRELAGNLLDDLSDETAGHYLWLTAQGHGLGFWDLDLVSDKVGDRLTSMVPRTTRCYVEFNPEREEMYL